MGDFEALGLEALLVQQWEARVLGEEVRVRDKEELSRTLRTLVLPSFALESSAIVDDARFFSERSRNGDRDPKPGDGWLISMKFKVSSAMCLA